MQILTDWLNLNPIRFMASIVFALLVVSSSIVFILAKLKPSQNFKELSDRINSWWIMAFLFFSSVLIDSRAAIVLSRVAILRRSTDSLRA
jgi:phosphatidate cytidylyltransferase